MRRRSRVSSSGGPLSSCVITEPSTKSITNVGTSSSSPCLCGCQHSWRWNESMRQTPSAASPSRSTVMSPRRQRRGAVVGAPPRANVRPTTRNVRFECPSADGLSGGPGRARTGDGRRGKRPQPLEFRASDHGPTSRGPGFEKVVQVASLPMRLKHCPAPCFGRPIDGTAGAFRGSRSAIYRGSATR